MWSERTPFILLLATSCNAHVTWHHLHRPYLASDSISIIIADEIAHTLSYPVWLYNTFQIASR